jgi:xanthine dehydrogenase accessory factor
MKMKNIYLQILDHKDEISSLVLATVTMTHGSTPQKPGSSALFGKNGLIAGTVGGGVVEGRVDKLAREAILAKKSGQFTFDLANDISKKEEAICGGQITVLLDANLQNLISVAEQLKLSLSNRIPGVLITMVNRFSDDMVLVNRYWMNVQSFPDIPEEFRKEIEPVALDMITGKDPFDYRHLDLSVEEKEPVSRFYLEPVFPPAHLVIAGAGHIGKSLAHLGDMIDFEVTVIDDREEYANHVNIPEADHIIVGSIGESVKSIKKGDDTYVVIVTRGHKDDAEALRPCIGTDLAYLGMIGSKKKIGSMKTSFIENGWATEEQWNSIYSPIGLEIKSKTVEEIAISIAAQLIQVRNNVK